MPIDQVQLNGREQSQIPVSRREAEVGQHGVVTQPGVRIHKAVAELPCRIDEVRIDRSRRAKRIGEAGGRPSE